VTRHASRSSRSALALAACIALTAVGCAGTDARDRSATPPLHVEIYRSSPTSARLNTYLVYGERDLLLVDASMTRADAEAVGERIDATGRTLRTIFITNSQPDKHLGLAILTERFPEAHGVSTPEVIEDMRERGPGYVKRLRARYGDRVSDRLVLPEPIEDDALVLEGREIRVFRFEGGECPHAAALYVPSLRALFPGAIVFQDSHLFLRERDIPGWRRHLAWIREHGGIERIYPGHGLPTDPGVVDEMERYLDDFEAAVALGEFDAALAFLRARYPDYDLERLLREYSLPAYLPR
jgi:glyoxylase-like metal-dependent hydrolase (beta-lactamase superfamily II)